MGLDKKPVRLTYALGMAKEHCKPETYNHALRVMQYVADNETIPYEYQEDCLVLAVIHDLLEDTDYPRGCGLGKNFTFEEMESLLSYSGYQLKKAELAQE